MCHQFLPGICICIFLLVASNYQNNCNKHSEHFSCCCLTLWLMWARHVCCEHCELLWLDSQMERNVNLEQRNAATSQTQEWDGGPHKNTLIGISKLTNFWTAKWMNCLPGSNQYLPHNWSSTCTLALLTLMHNTDDFALILAASCFKVLRLLKL